MSDKDAKMDTDETRLNALAAQVEAHELAIFAIMRALSPDSHEYKLALSIMKGHAKKKEGAVAAILGELIAGIERRE